MSLIFLIFFMLSNRFDCASASIDSIIFSWDKSSDRIATIGGIFSKTLNTCSFALYSSANSTTYSVAF